MTALVTVITTDRTLHPQEHLSLGSITATTTNGETVALDHRKAKIISNNSNTEHLVILGDHDITYRADHPITTNNAPTTYNPRHHCLHSIQTIHIHRDHLADEALTLTCDRAELYEGYFNKVALRVDDAEIVYI